METCVEKGPSWNSWNLNPKGGGDSGKGNEQLEGGGRGCRGVVHKRGAAWRREERRIVKSEGSSHPRQ